MCVCSPAGAIYLQTGVRSDTEGEKNQHGLCVIRETRTRVSTSRNRGGGAQAVKL